MISDSILLGVGLAKLVEDGMLLRSKNKQSGTELLSCKSFHDLLKLTKVIFSVVTKGDEVVFSIGSKGDVVGVSIGSKGDVVGDSIGSKGDVVGDSAVSRDEGTWISISPSSDSVGEWSLCDCCSDKDESLCDCWSNEDESLCDCWSDDDESDVMEITSLTDIFEEEKLWDCSSYSLWLSIDKEEWDDGKELVKDINESRSCVGIGLGVSGIDKDKIEGDSGKGKGNFVVVVVDFCIVFDLKWVVVVMFDLFRDEWVGFRKFEI